MKQYNNNLENNLVGLNSVNGILKAKFAQFSEQYSSCDSLLSLLNAGIERQSQGDANASEMFPKRQDTSFDVSKSAKIMERGYTTQFDDPIRRQLKVELSRKTKKSKHNELPSEDVAIGNEPKHKKKNKIYTDTSEDDYNDNTKKKKRDRSVSSNDIFAEPTVGDETVRKTKGKHKQLPSEEVAIGSEPKHKKKNKIYTDTSEDDYNDNTKKKKRDTSVSSNDIFAEPTVGDETVRKTKGKHKQLPSEEVEIGSEPKHKKKNKKYTDTSEDDYNDNTKKKKRDRSVSSNDIFAEPTVGDETVRKTKSKHNELPSEDVEIGSEPKHKKKNKKYTDTSEDDYNDNTKKKKRDTSVSLNDIFAEPTVADETVRKTKGKHKELPSEEVEIGSEPKHKKKNKKYTDTSEDDYNDNTKKKKRDTSVSSNDIFAEPTVADETVRKTKGKHKEVPSEVEIGSEPKHKKKNKKYTDTSEDDYNNNTKKRKRDRTVSSNDIFAEGTVGDETVTKKKGRHKEFLSEEVEIESELKHKKKKKKHTDTSERDLNDGDSKIIRDHKENGNIKKRKRNISIISSDLNSEPPVVEDETIREKKKKKHKKLLDTIKEHQASGIEPFQLHNSNWGASLDITDYDLTHNNVHASTPFKAGKKNRSFTPPKDSLTITDEGVRLKKLHKKVKHPEKAVKSEEDAKEILSDSDDPYYDTLMKNQLDLDDVKFLKGIHVLIPFDVPQTHLIETRISSKPTQQQKEQFKSLKVTMSARPYTKAEDTSIKTNWEEFCRTHDVPNKPELFMSLATEGALPLTERINFVRFLGHGLEHRMLFSIYARFKVLFSTSKRGKFTSEEDATIKDIMLKPNVANKFSTLAAMLGRSRESIKAHYAVLNNEKVSWSLELMKDLIDNLMKVLGKDVLDELKTAAVERPHWVELGKLMGISGVKLRRKWMEYIYPRLFAGNYNNLIEVRRKLINLLYDSSKYDRKEIDWNELALNFDGMSGSRLYKVFVDLMNSCVPKNVKKNFKDAINYLKNDYLVGLQTSTPMNFVRLQYQNGKLWEMRT